MYIPANRKKGQCHIPLIIEIGELNTHAGWAGYDCPHYTFPSAFGINEENEHVQLEWGKSKGKTKTEVHEFYSFFFDL